MRNKKLVNKFGTLIEVNRELKKIEKAKKKPRTEIKIGERARKLYQQGYVEGFKAGVLAEKHR